MTDSFSTARKLSGQASPDQAPVELLELAHDAIFVRDLRTGNIRYWNRGAEETYGWNREEALGNASHVLLQTRFPEPLEEIEAAVIDAGHWEGELIQKTRDGREIVVVSRWALQKEDGRPVAFLEVNRDITARKHAEDRVRSLLSERERRLQELAQSHAEVLQRNRELTAINHAVEAITAAIDLPEVLQNIVDAARDLLQSRYAALGVADEQGRIVQFITSGISPEQRLAIGPLPQGHGLLGVLIQQGKPLRVPMISDHPESQGFPPNHPPMTSLLGVPIILHGRVLGDLYLTDKIGAPEFSKNDQDLLLLLARQAGIAIQNARLYEQMRAARDQVRRWNKELEAKVAERTRQIEEQARALTTAVLQAQEDERKRIARELHDETAQSLSALLISLDAMQPSLDEGDAVVKAGFERVRALSHDLRPTILDDVGLPAALQWFADEFSLTFATPVAVEVEDIPAYRLSSDTEVALFRIAQEALTNSGKYSRAASIRLSLSLTDQEAMLTIEDNGVGFVLDRARGPSRQGGLGMYGMRERAEIVGGTLSIDTAPGQGTRVTARAPLNERGRPPGADVATREEDGVA